MRTRFGCFTPLALVAVTLAGVAMGAPPALDVPAEVRPAGGYARFTPKTEAVTVLYIGLDGIDPFPSEELKDGRRFLLPVAGVKPGRYRFAAVGAKDGEQTRADFVVVVGDVQPDPKPKPNPDPKPDPDVVKVDSVWVIVVEDAAGPRTVETAQALNDPFWQALRPKHDFRHYQSDSATAVGNGYVEQAKAVGMPAVLILDKKDGAPLKAFKLGKVADINSAVREVAK